MKTKEQFLEERGWEKMVGYCFDACRAEDEMIRMLSKGNESFETIKTRYFEFAAEAERWVTR